jgi:hypothetical protein
MKVSVFMRENTVFRQEKLKLTNPPSLLKARFLSLSSTAWFVMRCSDTRPTSRKVGSSAASGT